MNETPLKFFLDMKELEVALNLSRSSIYREHRAGRLPLRKLAGKTVATVEDARAYASAAPLAPIRNAADRAA
jgi:predicted DNA-binding transcriptional regulator AlpA